jgi:two-component system cell cycle sensor histidine kinase/response regulator CckA
MKDLSNGAAAINPPEFQADLRTLLLAQKTELFSEITRATANQFNNTMMAITSYAELEMRTASPSQRRSLEQVLSNVGKATALVQKLLAFSNKQANSPQPLNLNQVVSGIDNLLEQLTSERVALVYQLEESLPMVMAEMAEVEQVTLSLAIMARNAMQAGGEITISTRVVNVTKDTTSESDGELQGEYVALSIDDTGSGAVAVAPTDYSGLDLRVNLALAAVRGVVKNAGGFVRVKSEPGKGNSFTIHFPALRQKSLEHSDRARVRIAPTSRTLLVVEDDDAVRVPTSEFLKMEGFKVLQARTGDEAIHAAQQNRSPLDVLITDIVMPKMTGRQVAGRLLELHPNLKVLYMSGDTEAQPSQSGEPAAHAVLRKPFRLEALKERILELLGEELTDADR